MNIINAWPTTVLLPFLKIVNTSFIKVATAIDVKISVDINKDRDNPMRMTAFVTIEGEEAFLASNEWSKEVVLPVRNKYKHENLVIDADLVAKVVK